MAKVTKFPISHSQRELNRRGRMSLNCIVSDRWIKIGEPDWASPNLGTPVEIDVMRAYSNSTGGDHRICSLIITVDQLRSLLQEIESRRLLGLNGGNDE